MKCKELADPNCVKAMEQNLPKAELANQEVGKMAIIMRLHVVQVQLTRGICKTRFA